MNSRFNLFYKSLLRLKEAKSCPILKNLEFTLKLVVGYPTQFYIIFSWNFLYSFSNRRTQSSGSWSSGLYSFGFPHAFRAYDLHFWVVTTANMSVNVTRQKMSAKLMIVPSLLEPFFLHLALFDETKENDKVHEVFYVWAWYKFSCNNFSGIPIKASNTPSSVSFILRNFSMPS